MDKVAFVVPRFGEEAGGGAETECMETAKRLTDTYAVDILTSCANDYITWENVYKEGITEDYGLTIRRFMVEDHPDEAFFESLKVHIYSNPEHEIEDEITWSVCRGPFCPELIEYIKQNSNSYAAIFYASYPWYTTTAGLLLNLTNSVFMPMAHDERQIYLNLFKKVFTAARAFIYNTETERELVNSLFDVSKKPYRICGMAVTTRTDVDDCLPKNIPMNYALYVGRISDSKNISELFKFYIEYKRLHNNDLQLIVVGKQDREYIIPFHPSIHYLGFVTDGVKHALIKNSKFVIMPSKNESLSITVLESLAYGRPVIVNGRSRVLKEHCISSNAGFYYYNYFEFEAEAEYLLSNKNSYECMSENGIKYVDDNYQWQTITNRFTELIKEIHEC